MAHAFILQHGPEAEMSQYDAIMKDMDLGGVLPQGALFHAAGKNETGFFVCDVWESPEAFQAFAQTRIGPLSAKHGVAPPKVTDFEVARIREGAPGDVGLMQIVTIPGVDAARFDALDEAVLGPERAAPDGCVFHVNGQVGDDWMVIDYWTTTEANEAFIGQKAAPALEAAGVPMPPIEAVPVHNALTPQRVAA